MCTYYCNCSGYSARLPRHNKLQIEGKNCSSKMKSNLVTVRGVHQIKHCTHVHMGPCLKPFAVIFRAPVVHLLCTLIMLTN